jgi:hypothetical protein
VTQDGVTIPAPQRDVSAALKEDVSQVTIECWVVEIVGDDAVEDHHPHSTPNVVTDKMWKDGRLDVYDDPHWYRFSRMEIGRRGDGAYLRSPTR